MGVLDGCIMKTESEISEIEEEILCKLRAFIDWDKQRRLGIEMYSSQKELEKEMFYVGRYKSLTKMSENDGRGKMNFNKYSDTIYRRFVSPLAEKIRHDMKEKGPGKHKSHIVLLKKLDPEVVAYIAVRTLFAELLKNTESGNGRRVIYKVGSSVQSEMVLTQFLNLNEERFFYLQKELEKKQSQDVNHRTNIYKKELWRNGVEPIDWGHGSRDQVGSYLCDVLTELGLLDIKSYSVVYGGRFYRKIDVSLVGDVLALISDTRERIAETTPYFLPCIEKPNDWKSMHDGGFHTPEIRKMSECSAIIGGDSGNGDNTMVYNSLNCLQSVSWAINTDVLDVVMELSKDSNLGNAEQQANCELVVGEEPPKPIRPDFLEGREVSSLSKKEEGVFKDYKKKMAEFYTNCKLRKQSIGRMGTALRVSHMFKAYSNLYFVYHCDFRGRVYPFGVGPNPQGSDLQRSLLTFAEGKAIDTPDAEKWFFINGANKFGYDKASIKERVAWVKDNLDMILSTADDPVNNIDWLWEADKPFQFLAWAFEFKAWTEQGSKFKSKLPCSLDGSCNGLQNFSALLLDEVGGKATNLTDTVIPRDIYTEVCNEVTKLLRAMKEDKLHLRSKWLRHGIQRACVKRSVMTMPYGSTRFSCRDFVLKDYMKKTDMPEFKKDEFAKASVFLSKVLWEAIGNVVIKAREAMSYMQKVSNIILKHEDVIKWKTPNGMLVVQDYRKYEDSGKVRVNIFGGTKFRYKSETKLPDSRRHRQGVSPNFIHSMDASHMQRVVTRAAKEGIDYVAAIHDDFGTHCADTEKLFRIIREEFVDIYSEDNWLYKFVEYYRGRGIDLPDPPETGNLDITEVLNSRYFFI